MLDTAFWKKYFKEYDVLNQLIPYVETLTAIETNLDVEQGEKILDVGSGTGNLSAVLQKHGAAITGVDYSAEGIAVHQAKNPEAVLIQHDLTKPLPFPDNYFDKIASNNVLYTLSPVIRPAVARELCRVLKPGGLIVISNLAAGFKPRTIYMHHVQAYYSQHGIWKTARHIASLLIPTIKIFYYNYLISREHSAGSYGFFKEGEQRALLTDAGFSPIRSEKQYAGQAVLDVARK